MLNTDLYLSMMLDKNIAMKMNFVPTLQCIALTKVAIGIYSNSEILSFEMGLKSGPFHYTPTKKWEPFIREKVSNFPLPEVFLKKVIDLIVPLSVEHLAWKSDHAFIISPFFPAINYFCWTSLGMIDWFETAKRLVAHPDFTFFQRFILCCYYCLKNDAQTLWRNASETERQNLVNLSPHSKEYHLMHLNREVFKKWFNWLDLRSDLCPSVYNAFDIFPNIPFHMCFFQTCSPESVMEFLAEKRNIKWDSNNTHLAADFVEIKICCKRMTCETLRLFLKWPWQVQFNEMADYLRNHLTENSFLELLECICQKIESNWKDYDYVNILNDFWKNSPDALKTYAKAHAKLYRFRKHIPM